MAGSFKKNTAGLLLIIVAGVFLSAQQAPAAESQTSLQISGKTQSIVLAGGCFWGMQAVFQHTKGVVKAVSGYEGGKAETAHYETVSTGETGHAESVKITYNPEQVTLDKLLDIYFLVAHNPTELNYQGPDHGTQYRSAVFTDSPVQQKLVQEKIAALNASRHFSDPVVTKVEPLSGFYPAEAYHQNYATLYPYDPYILINDAPKVTALKKQFPELYQK